MTSILAIAILSVLSTRAESVSPSIVCQVQNAIRYREAAWTPEICEVVATALNTTPAPRTTLAIAVLESDLRPHIVATPRPGVHDVGLLGVRCVTSSARDFRSRLPDGMATGRCLVGPARGYTVAELQEVAVNVRVAVAIMEQKKRIFGRYWLRAYNGGTREHGYARNIAAIEKALDGKQSMVKNPRVRKLVRQIVEAVNNGRKS